MARWWRRSRRKPAPGASATARFGCSASTPKPRAATRSGARLPAGSGGSRIAAWPGVRYGGRMNVHELSSLVQDKLLADLNDTTEESWRRTIEINSLEDLSAQKREKAIQAAQDRPFQPAQQGLGAAEVHHQVAVLGALDDAVDDRTRSITPGAPYGAQMSTRSPRAFLAGSSTSTWLALRKFGRPDRARRSPSVGRVLPQEKGQRGLQQRIRGLLCDVVPARDTVPTDVAGHEAPFGQRIEALLDDAVQAPQHQ